MNTMIRIIGRKLSSISAVVAVPVEAFRNWIIASILLKNNDFFYYIG